MVRYSVTSRKQVTIMGNHQSFITSRVVADFEWGAVWHASPRRAAVFTVLERAVKRRVHGRQVVHAHCRPVHARPDAPFNNKFAFSFIRQL